MAESEKLYVVTSYAVAEVASRINLDDDWMIRSFRM